MENGQKSSARLLKFLKDNEVFLKDNPVLFEDLKTVSEAFYDFFATINTDAEKRQTLIILGKFIDRIENGLCHIDNQTRQNAIINMRFNFYKFIHHKIMLHRENTVEWMLSMPKNSIFRNLKMPHTPKNMQEWSKNEFIAFHTLAIFYAWFNETWLKYIDDFFHVSFEDIRKVVKNDLE